MAKQESEESEKKMVNYFDRLPEGCIADVVSHTTPVDACNMALVSTTFHSIADSDPVWNTFLPSDYRQLISRAVDNQPIHRLLRSSPSNKDVYLSLSDHPLILDAGALSFSLDKRTGKKCFMLAASSLTIVWSVGTPWYWRWISDLESRFVKVAELISVCWFEIHGRISTSLLSGGTAYNTYLVYKLATTMYGFEDLPLEISVGIIGEETIKSSVFVYPEDAVQGENVSRPRGRGFLRRFRDSHPGPQVASPLNVDPKYPRTRKDGWLEVELGQYFNKEGENRELEITLLELKGQNWKSGLIIQGLEIRPMDGI